MHADTHSHTYTHVELPLCANNKFYTVEIVVTMPNVTRNALETFPLAVISNGCFIPDTQYTSYAQRLASWGYVVAQWNPYNTLFSLNHALRAQLLVKVVNLVQAQFEGVINTKKVFGMGHSLGGKTTVLAAEMDPRFRGVCVGARSGRLCAAL